MTKGEFEEMTKDELVNYADDHDIEVHHHWTKDEIIKEIMKAEKAAAKEEAKQEEQPVAKSAEVPADAPSPIDPELAKQQELAQKMPDENTRFASGAKADE
jgi:hypothetical protein